MSRGPDAAVLLERALAASAAAAGVALTITGWRTVRWAPATFTGTRHELAFLAPADIALDAWLAALPEAELAMRGHFVGELKVIAQCEADGLATVQLAVLTVEEN